MAKRPNILIGVALGTSLTSLLATGCSAEAPRPAVAVDCSAADAYELDVKRNFEGQSTWFGSGDSTNADSFKVSEPSGACVAGGSAGSAATGGTPTPGVSATLESTGDLGRCGSQQALVLRTTGHSDWGSLFGDYDLHNAPWDGTGYDGIALWARKQGGDPALTLALDTWQTSAEGATPQAGEEICKPDCNAGSGTQVVDAAGNILSQSYVSPPGTCGNSFQRVLQVTEQWQLYLLPFSSFYQDLKPNMSPNGLNPRHINGMTFRASKEATLEIWIDDVALYKRK
jgi:hypothetical protein